MQHDITTTQRDTILAALRYWQNRGSAHQPMEELEAIAGEHGAALDADAIDALCEALNVGLSFPNEAARQARLDDLNRQYERLVAKDHNAGARKIMERQIEEVSLAPID